jgi:murein DD-endopeptidase / murein LD-carboxypeptidase
MILKQHIILLLVFSTGFAFSQNDTTSTTTDTSAIVSFFSKYQCELNDQCYLPLYAEIYNLKHIPYRYGGRSEKALDCSGFAIQVYEKAYRLPLPGSSSKEIFQQTKNVKPDDMQEGDLVFFKIKKGMISHVGIYLGNNKFAHTTTQAGIIISDLSEPYYKRYFYKATRALMNVGKGLSDEE